jgi:hypothetical protein
MSHCNTSETLGNSVIDDISVFCQKTAEGTLYDYIEEETNIRTGAVTQSRDDFKKIVFKSLYSSNSFINQLEAAEKRIFNAIFPKVSYVYNLIKQVDHRTLAILLQRIESRFILDIVTKQISSTYPGIPVYTIHDSIAFPVGLEKNIEALVLAASREYLGIKMTLKMEYWRP